MNVIWTPEAEQDRADVFDWIAADNPIAASRMDKLFNEATTKLRNFPKMGRAGELPGTRELFPHESYRLVYQIYEETVWVLALVHTARHWPPIRK